MTRELLKLSLPFYPERILKVLQTVQNGKIQQKDVITSLEKSEGWYVRKAQTYFRYCVHWRLLSSNEKCELTALGKAILLLSNAKLHNVVKEIIYYSFASSETFKALGILIQNLFNRLETSGPFNFTNADVPFFIPKFKGRHDISDLVNILNKITILKRERKNGKFVYSLSYYAPSLGSFAISLLHYIQSNRLSPPHNIKSFDIFRAYWFISKEMFTQYLRRCRGAGWMSYQEYADINQFQFNIDDIEKLTKDIVKRGAII